MNINLPFVYSAEAVVGRKKNADTVYFFDFVSGDVPEIDESEAPVAVSLGEGGTRKVVRYFDGGFVVPAGVLGRESEPLAAKAFAKQDRSADDTIATSIARMNLLPVGDDLWHAHNNLLGRNRKDPPKDNEIKEIVKTTVDSRRTAAQAILDGLVVIDGALWRKVPEPVLAVHRETTDKTKAAYLELVVDGVEYNAPFDLGRNFRIRDPETTQLFRADDIIEARNCLGALEDGRWSVYDGTDRDYVVHMTDVFGFDKADNAARRAAEYCVAEYRGPIGHYSNPTVQAWVDIRERLANAPSIDKDVIEHLATELVPAFLAALGDKDEGNRRKIEKGLSDWEEGLSISLGSGLRFGG